jgi:hypothetical protein
MSSRHPRNGSDNDKKIHPAVAALRCAHRLQHALRIGLSLVGGGLAVLSLWWSLGKPQDVLHKMADAFGGALLFASITGLTVSIVHLLSGVERRERALWQAMISAQHAPAGPAETNNAA